METSQLTPQIILVDPVTSTYTNNNGGPERGIAVLVAGTVVVSSRFVTATSNIQLTYQGPLNNPGILTVISRIPGTSFTIVSLGVGDTSTVAWVMFH